MKTLADTALPAPAVDRRWLWVARLAPLACLLLLFAVLLMGWDARVLLPWMLAYLLALLGMQSRWCREAALRLAVVIGALGTAVWLGVFCFAHIELAWGSIGSIFFGLLAATNLLLLLSTRKMLRKRTLSVRVSRWVTALVASCALILIGFGVLLNEPHPGAGGPAVGSLRTINAAQFTYASTYPHRGYAVTLAALGPPPKGSKPSEDAAGLLDPVLEIGQHRGYRFTFIPGPPDQKGRTTSYRVIARPLEYGQTRLRSYYTDESGVIRATTENRVATAQDPPL